MPTDSFHIANTKVNTQFTCKTASSKLNGNNPEPFDENNFDRPLDENEPGT